MIQVTCWRSPTGQNTCNFAKIIHKFSSFLYSEYVTACMCVWCSLPLLCGETKSLNKSMPKNVGQHRLDYDCITLGECDYAYHYW